MLDTSWLNFPSGKSVNPRSVTAESCSVLPPVAAQVTVAIVLNSVPVEVVELDSDQ